MPLRMMLRLAALAFVILSLSPSVGHAEGRAEVFALIVTNNLSAELSRPELRYADDDGVKYAELFRTIARPEHVHLLTELDADTHRLFPGASATTRAPTRAAVLAAVRTIAREVSALRTEGRQVDFYFVFAGHGDVDRGEGFLELRDGRFGASDVEDLLRSISATRSHVLLDSCNSFFVLNARKPGGRRVAVTGDAAASIGERLPNVGVFLSTSAEAEVFEWSELQSGIFSHAVRSGLSGAADANADGEVSYDELSAFVYTATSGVDNPLYRPDVFARGPAGEGGAAIFSTRAATGVRVELGEPAQARVTLRDAHGVPWLDAHKEGLATLRLIVPKDRALGAVLEQRDPGGRVLARFGLELSEDMATPAALLALAPGAADASPRGIADMLRRLFAAPFGPRALAAYVARPSRNMQQVYGVSREDTDRMRRLLAHAADVDASDRVMTNTLRLGSGALFLVGSALTLARGTDYDYGRALAYGFLGAGALSVGLGTYGLAFQRSPGEQLYEEFERGLGGQRIAAPQLVARTESKLLALSARYRFDRRLSATIGMFAVALGVGALVYNEFADYGEEERMLLRVAIAMPTGVVLGLSTYLLFPSPMERIAALWSSEPGIMNLPRLSISPVRSDQELTGAVFRLEHRF